MVEIETVKNIEQVGAVGSLCAERAVLSAIASAGGNCVVNTPSVYAMQSGDTIVCIAQSHADIEKAVDISAYDKTVIFSVQPISSHRLRSVTLYAYLEPMPPLPSGRVEIKRLAPTLKDTVAAAVGRSEQIETLMYGRGIYGAIADGKLAGFVGQCDCGDDILHVYDRSDKDMIAEELTRFLTTLVMTGGHIPFVLTDDAHRGELLTSCGFVRGKLFAYMEKDCKS